MALPPLLTRPHSTGLCCFKQVFKLSVPPHIFGGELKGRALFNHDGAPPILDSSLKAPSGGALPGDGIVGM